MYELKSILSIINYEQILLINNPARHSSWAIQLLQLCIDPCMLTGTVETNTLKLTTFSQNGIFVIKGGSAPCVV